MVHHALMTAIHCVVDVLVVVRVVVLCRVVILAETHVIMGVSIHVKMFAFRHAKIVVRLHVKKHV